MKKFATLISLIFLCMIIQSFCCHFASGEANGSNFLPSVYWYNFKKFHILLAVQQAYVKVFKSFYFSKKQRNDAAILVRGKFKDKNKDGIDDRYKHIMGGRLALIKLKGEKGKDLASNALRSLQNHPK